VCVCVCVCVCVSVCVCVCVSKGDHGLVVSDPSNPEYDQRRVSD